MWPRLLGMTLVMFSALFAKGYWNATRPPVVRTARIAVSDWPAGVTPLRILHVSDIHVAGPDMPPERLDAIVSQLNALDADLVLIAGDLISEKRVATRIYSPSEIVAPLGRLRAKYGVVAVLGNHDHWAEPEALRRSLENQGVAVLQNAALRRGPLIIGGVDDDFSGHDDVTATFVAMAALGPGPQVVLTHSPDIMPTLPLPVAAVFAGHTHCGQISLPIVGALAYMSRYGARFACGIIDHQGSKVVVGAGLGTSLLPLRYGAAPDVWLVTLGAAGRS